MKKNKKAVSTITPFPAVSKVDLVFPCLTSEEMDHWKKEAEDAKYDSAFADMASLLFFKGGLVPKRTDISAEEYSHGRAYLQKWLGSFDPKHEVKELVTGYILSRISVLEGR